MNKAEPSDKDEGASHSNYPTKPEQNKDGTADVEKVQKYEELLELIIAQVEKGKDKGDARKQSIVKLKKMQRILVRRKEELMINNKILPPLKKLYEKLEKVLEVQKKKTENKNEDCFVAQEGKNRSAVVISSPQKSNVSTRVISSPPDCSVKGSNLEKSVDKSVVFNQSETLLGHTENMNANLSNARENPFLCPKTGQKGLVERDSGPSDSPTDSQNFNVVSRNISHPRKVLLPNPIIITHPAMKQPSIVPSLLDINFCFSKLPAGNNRPLVSYCQYSVHNYEYKQSNLQGLDQNKNIHCSQNESNHSYITSQKSCSTLPSDMISAEKCTVEVNNLESGSKSILASKTENKFFKYNNRDPRLRKFRNLEQSNERDEILKDDNDNGCNLENLKNCNQSVLEKRALIQDQQQSNIERFKNQNCLPENVNSSNYLKCNVKENEMDSSREMVPSNRPTGRKYDLFHKNRSQDQKKDNINCINQNVNLNWSNPSDTPELNDKTPLMTSDKAICPSENFIEKRTNDNTREMGYSAEKNKLTDKKFSTSSFSDKSTNGDVNNNHNMLYKNDRENLISEKCCKSSISHKEGERKQFLKDKYEYAVGDIKQKDFKEKPVVSKDCRPDNVNGSTNHQLVIGENKSANRYNNCEQSFIMYDSMHPMQSRSSIDKWGFYRESRWDKKPADRSVSLRRNNERNDSVQSVYKMNHEYGKKAGDDIRASQSRLLDRKPFDHFYNSRREIKRIDSIKQSPGTHHDFHKRFFDRYRDPSPSGYKKNFGYNYRDYRREFSKFDSPQHASGGNCLRDARHYDGTRGRGTCRKSSSRFRDSCRSIKKEYIQQKHCSNHNCNHRAHTHDSSGFVLTDKNDQQSVEDRYKPERENRSDAIRSNSSILNNTEKCDANLNDLTDTCSNQSITLKTFEDDVSERIEKNQHSPIKSSNNGILSSSEFKESCDFQKDEKSESIKEITKSSKEKPGKKRPSAEESNFIKNNPVKKLCKEKNKMGSSKSVRSSTSVVKRGKFPNKLVTQLVKNTSNCIKEKSKIKCILNSGNDAKLIKELNNENKSCPPQISDDQRDKGKEIDQTREQAWIAEITTDSLSASGNQAEKKSRSVDEDDGQSRSIDEDFANEVVKSYLQKILLSKGYKTLVDKLEEDHIKNKKLRKIKKIIFSSSEDEDEKEIIKKSYKVMLETSTSADEVNKSYQSDLLGVVKNTVQPESVNKESENKSEKEIVFSNLEKKLIPDKIVCYENREVNVEETKQDNVSQENCSDDRISVKGVNTTNSKNKSNAGQERKKFRTELEKLQEDLLGTGMFTSGLASTGGLRSCRLKQETLLKEKDRKSKCSKSNKVQTDKITLEDTGIPNNSFTSCTSHTECRNDLCKPNGNDCLLLVEETLYNNKFEENKSSEATKTWFRNETNLSEELKNEKDLQTQTTISDSFGNRFSDSNSKIAEYSIVEKQIKDSDSSTTSTDDSAQSTLSCSTSSFDSVQSLSFNKDISCSTDQLQRKKPIMKKYFSSSYSTKKIKTVPKGVSNEETPSFKFWSTDKTDIKVGYLSASLKKGILLFICGVENCNFCATLQADLFLEHLQLCHINFKFNAICSECQAELMESDMISCFMHLLRYHLFKESEVNTSMITDLGLLSGIGGTNVTGATEDSSLQNTLRIENVRSLNPSANQIPAPKNSFIKKSGNVLKKSSFCQQLKLYPDNILSPLSLIGDIKTNQSPVQVMVVVEQLLYDWNKFDQTPKIIHPQTQTSVSFLSAKCGPLVPNTMSKTLSDENTLSVISTGSQAVPRSFSSSTYQMKRVSKSLYGILKHPKIFKLMLTPTKLKHLYKCMESTCTFTSDCVSEFEFHCNHIHEKFKTGMSSSLSSGAKYLCAYCSCSFIASKGLCSHIIEKHLLSDYQCGYCFYRTCCTSNVILHQNVTHNTQDIFQMFKWPLYSYSHTSLNNQSRPKKSDVILPYVCYLLFCSLKFYTPDGFRKHLQAHFENQSVYVCSYCNGEFSKEEYLFFHYKIHSINQYQCLYCLHATDTEQDMRRHLCVQHPGDMPRAVKRENQNLRLNESFEIEHLEDLKVCNFDDQAVVASYILDYALTRRLYGNNGNNKTQLNLYCHENCNSTDGDDMVSDESLNCLPCESVANILHNLEENSQQKPASSLGQRLTLDADSV